MASVPPNQSKSVLTQEQLVHFEVFGFAVVRQMFSSDEVDIIGRDFEDVFLEDRGGRPFDGRDRQVVVDWFQKRPDAANLFYDERIRGPIKQLLGPGYVALDGNDGNFYVGNTGWHPDMGWDPAIPEGEQDPYRQAGNLSNHYVPSIKVAFYLDPVDRDTGCLRVIPGSHRNPLHDELWSLHLDIPDRAKSLAHVRPKLQQMWERKSGSAESLDHLFADSNANLYGLAPRDMPSYAIESKPGDAVFFSHQLWHASFGGRTGRRMFTLNFRSAPPFDGSVDAGEHPSGNS
jgi:hypothetical protein